MSHTLIHRYLWAVCCANGCRPEDWGEAKLLLRVLSLMGLAPSIEEVFPPRVSTSEIANDWLNAFGGQ